MNLKKSEKWTFKNQFFVKATKLGNYNQGDWLFLKDLLNEWVSKGFASDPHDFTK